MVARVLIQNSCPCYLVSIERGENLSQEDSALIDYEKAAAGSTFSSSCTGDIDILSSWYYLVFVFSESSSHDGNKSPYLYLLKINLVLSCIVGTISYLLIISDGWVFEWLRRLRLGGDTSHVYDRVNWRRFLPILLILGILFQDIPQIISTFLIEMISSKSPIDDLSNPGRLNLVIGTLALGNKLAEIYDRLNVGRRSHRTSP